MNALLSIVESQAHSLDFEAQRGSCEPTEGFRDAPDGTEILRFQILGDPRTKKNSQRIVKIGRFSKILPSKAFCEYQDVAESYCKNAMNGRAPIDFGCSIEVRAVMRTWNIPDHCGILQSIGDILQAHGVVGDDQWITFICPTGHWLSVEKHNPHLDLIIRRHRHPYEEYCRKRDKLPVRSVIYGS